jgi:transposase-like protein
MTEASFQELLNRRKESGLTVRDFCSNEGIAESIYYYWLKKLKKREAQPEEFIPLFVNHQLPAFKKNQLSRLVPAESDPDHQSDTQLEFVFPNGTRLLVRNQFELSLLQTIAHLYD